MIYQMPVYSGGQFQSVLYWLNSWGLQDAILPFLLIFTLLFAVLQKISIFTKTETGGVAKPDRKINGILSFVIAALVVIPHITGYYSTAFGPNSDPVVVINTFLPATAILLLVMLMVIILTGFVGGVPNTVIRLVAIVATLVLLITIVSEAWPGLAPAWLQFSDPNLQALVIVLLVFGLVVWFVTKDDDQNATLTVRVEGYSGLEIF